MCANTIDNIYLNINIKNNSNNTNGSISENTQIAEYSVTKTQPILDKSSDYFCSVLRFDIPLNLIPIMVMPIVPATTTNNPQMNPNLTTFIIGISYNGTDYPQNVSYIPDNSFSPPIQNVIGNQVITPYYYVYSYDNLITSVNIALGNAFTASGLSGLPPYFYLDSQTQLISLIVPDSFTNGGNIPLIFLNAVLLNYFEAIRVNFIGTNQINGKDCYYILTTPNYSQSCDYGGNYVSINPPSRPSYWKFTQEYNVLSYWSSLRKIILSTNTIPVFNEFIPGTDNSGNINIFPILTDFVPQINNGGESRSIAYYYPTSQYRLIDLISDAPLYKINIRLYWEETINGTLLPIYLNRYSEINIKLGFFRKSLYKNMNLLLHK